MKQKVDGLFVYLYSFFAVHLNTMFEKNINRFVLYLIMIQQKSEQMHEISNIWIMGFPK